ncbi:hypothetical protein F4680DRAFT_253639 [Xylaria scruposa]|nr:hypothetical protein F4680DRAFT_253639 [Xylaria scruposa]
MREQEIANATPKPSSTKRKASGSSSSHPLLDATADLDMPHLLPSPSKRSASTIEVEDRTEHQHTRKRARKEGTETSIEHGQILGSDCSSDAGSIYPTYEAGSQQEDLQNTCEISGTEGTETAIKHGQVLGSDCSSDAGSTYPMRERKQEDPSEILRQQKSFEEIREAIRRWEKQRDLQCEAYRRFRLQRLLSPAPSDADDADDDNFPLDSDEFGHTPFLLGLDNDDPRVEEVFGLAYAQKLERRGLRKPSRRPTVQDRPDSPDRIQTPPSSVDDPK